MHALLKSVARAVRVLPALPALLAGCVAGPDYRRPELALPGHYTEAAATATEAASVPASSSNPSGIVQPAPGAETAPSDLAATWWTLFHSPALDQLVRTGLANNPNVGAAQAALRVAVENRRAQQAASLPVVSAAYAGTRQKVAGTLTSPLSSNAQVFSLSTAQLEISYTPDLFGGNRRQVESLQAQVDEQRWAAEATYLTLSSSLVVAAITEAGLREQADATRRVIAIQADLLARARQLRALGQDSELDVAQQESQLAALEATLPPLARQLALQRDQVKALTGALPDASAGADFRLDQLTLPTAIPLTLPSTLVDHRPDVLAAEAQLRAASADIGVAVANRLPQVTLGVNAWGSAAATLATLFSPGTGFWTLAGSVGQTVFDGGALKHREAAARAAYEQAEAQYRSTVINAYQNVADALQAIDADAASFAAARRAQDAAERTWAITRRQLELGDASAVAAILAEQAVQQALAATVQARANRLADVAALCQALGGGWWNRPPSDFPP